MLNSSNLISDEGKEETSMSERLWLIIWLGKREREREGKRTDSIGALVCSKISFTELVISFPMPSPGMLEGKKMIECFDEFP
jgi:hypothetical protein